MWCDWCDSMAGCPIWNAPDILVTPETWNLLAIKLDFLFCQNFDYVSDFTSGTKTETKGEFGSDFILKTKSNFYFWPFVACVPCKNQN